MNLFKSKSERPTSDEMRKKISEKEEQLSAFPETIKEFRNKLTRANALDQPTGDLLKQIQDLREMQETLPESIKLLRIELERILADEKILVMMKDLAEKKQHAETLKPFADAVLEAVEAYDKKRNELGYTEPSLSFKNQNIHVAGWNNPVENWISGIHSDYTGKIRSLERDANSKAISIEKGWS